MSAWANWFCLGTTTPNIKAPKIACTPMISVIQEQKKIENRRITTTVNLALAPGVLS